MIYQRINKILSDIWNVYNAKNQFIQRNISFGNRRFYNKKWNCPRNRYYFIATVAYFSTYRRSKQSYIHENDTNFEKLTWLEKIGYRKYSTKSDFSFPPIPIRKDLPFFSKKEISLHKNMEDRMWTTYKNGVYDITDFIGKHPGGDQIILAGGKPIEMFWLVSPVHFLPHVMEEFEKYRIGNLCDEEVETNFRKKNFYLNEPTGSRDPKLIPLTIEPFNAGVSEELLYARPITPSEYHFKRNHGPIPAIDMEKYVIEVEFEGKCNKLSLTLDELKKFPKHSVTSVLMCAGNRRDEMMKVRPKKGLRWTHNAVGNSIWSGAKLSDILRKAGLTEENTDVYHHVEFEGHDTDYLGANFRMSIPLWKAIDKRGEVIIAYEMNEGPIPVDNGFPVRVVVPGFAGARSVKWLKKIKVQPEECDSFNQQRLYKNFSPNVYYHNVDWDMSPAVDELPVISAICDPVDGGTATVNEGSISVKGYAYSGGGQKISRVDVSIDEGKNWHTANFTYQDDKKPPQHYSWSLWCCDIPVPECSKNCEIWVKAVDSCNNTQPERFEHIWNLRGVICNAYHKIKVDLC